jgi:hypothetical protein
MQGTGENNLKKEGGERKKGERRKEVDTAQAGLFLLPGRNQFGLTISKTHPSRLNDSRNE